MSNSFLGQLNEFERLRLAYKEANLRLSLAQEASRVLRYSALPSSSIASAVAAAGLVGASPLLSDVRTYLRDARHGIGSVDVIGNYLSTWREASAAIRNPLLMSNRDSALDNSNLFSLTGVGSIASSDLRSRALEISLGINGLSELQPTLSRLVEGYRDALPAGFREFERASETIRGNALWNSLRALHTGDFSVGGEVFSRETVSSWLEQLDDSEIETNEFWHAATALLQEVGGKFGRSAQNLVIWFVLVMVGGVIYDFVKAEANQQIGDLLPGPLQTQPLHSEIEKKTIRRAVQEFPDADFSDWRIVTVKTRLHVRAGPSSKSLITDHLEHAQWVRLIEKSENNDWSLVEYRNLLVEGPHYGWVYSRYLRKIAL